MDVNTLLAVLTAFIPIFLYLIKLNNEVVKHSVLIQEIKEDIKEIKKQLNKIVGG